MGEDLMKENLEQWELRMIKLVRHLEGMRIAEYLELLQRPRRLIFLNFVGGLSRGLGFVIGATLLVAIILKFLQQVLVLNIPWIGSIVAEIIHIVEQKNGY